MCAIQMYIIYNCPLNLKYLHYTLNVVYQRYNFLKICLAVLGNHSMLNSTTNHFCVVVVCI